LKEISLCLKDLFFSYKKKEWNSLVHSFNIRHLNSVHHKIWELKEKQPFLFLTYSWG